MWGSGSKSRDGLDRVTLTWRKSTINPLITLNLVCVFTGKTILQHSVCITYKGNVDIRVNSLSPRPRLLLHTAQVTATGLAVAYPLDAPVNTGPTMPL